MRDYLRLAKLMFVTVTGTLFICGIVYHNLPMFCVMGGATTASLLHSSLELYESYLETESGGQ